MKVNKMKDPVFYRIVRPIITFLFKIFYLPTIRGKENIPKRGRVILAGNHTNNLDCLLLISSTKRCIHFLAKDSLYKGWKKGIFKNMGIIPVDRSKKNKEAMDLARECLNNDLVIGIFPEGTINRTNEVIMPFKMGSVKMASDTDSMIVPFIITGKYKLFRKKINIEFLKPIKINKVNLEEENERLMNIIKEGLEGRK